MELIIGGAFQGKSDYAKKQHPEICWREGRDLGADEIFTASGVLNLHEFIRKEMQAGQDLEGFGEELIRRNPNLILTSCEIGYGVVPVDAFDRAYRREDRKDLHCSCILQPESDKSDMWNRNGDQRCLICG